MKIIFVCTGNTCRSPLAESIAKSLSDAHEFSSRGLQAFGAPVSNHSAAIIEEKGLPKVTGGERFTENDAHADLILTMSESHAHMLQTLYPEANVHALNVFINEQDDVEDPFGGSRAAYDIVYEQLNDYIEKALKIINH